MSAEVDTEIKTEINELNGKIEATLNDEPKQNGKNGKKVDEDDSEHEDFTEDLNLDHAFIKLSGNCIREFRAIKSLIEEVILKKIKNMDNLDKTHVSKKEKSVHYFKNFVIDNIGNSVGLGETGVAEGWSIPMYENEFRNSLGLPFTEDHAVSESLRIKRPRQECFNCLSINHRVQECPVKIDQERIDFNKNQFASQSQQSQEQAQLFSTRYTSDLDSKSNRGFVPGKISDQLREALGVKPNQLPPFIYIMREYGYPPGWLVEAKVKSSKLAVHDGVDAVKSETAASIQKEEGALSDEDSPKPKKDDDEILYDADKVYSFPGFNEPVAYEFIDESHFYKVKRYGPEFSKEKFLSTLKLVEKKKVVKRKHNKVDQESDESDQEAENGDKNDSKNSTNTSQNTNTDVEEANNEENSQDADQNDYSSPKKRRKLDDSIHGTSFTEILGTPIVNNVKGINRVPDWEQFSKDICEHKPFEMDSRTPTGSYQNIVKLTKEYKSNAS